MHHYVVPLKGAREQVTIEVQQVGDGGNGNGNGGNDDSEQEEDWYGGSDNYVLPKEFKFPFLTLQVRLNVPESLRNVQFIMEVKGGQNGTQFVDRGSMCDGKRSSSTKHYDPVTLRIPMMDDDDPSNNNNEPVELIAGWAAGMEAVSLTNKLVIQRAASSTTKNEEL
jgi:hypothetical protein